MKFSYHLLTIFKSGFNKFTIENYLIIRVLTKMINTMQKKESRKNYINEFFLFVSSL